MIRFDPAKRQWALEPRGRDFLDAEAVFAGPTIEVTDRRRDYGEVRIVSVGWLRGRAVIVVYTERNGIRHIISIRKANEREQRRFSPTSPEGKIHSDLQRVDAHVIRPEEYEELPEITEENLTHAVIKCSGQSDQPFRAKPSQAS